MPANNQHPPAAPPANQHHDPDDDDNANENTPLLPEPDSLEHFCLQLGIDPKSGEPVFPTSLYSKVKHSYYKQNTLYWALTATALGLMILQIAVSVTITALATTRSPDANTAVIILGAVNTFMAGTAAIIKSLGQPTRARQYRDALKRVWDAVDRMHGAFKNPTYSGKSLVAAQKLEEMYSQAVGDSEANAPDVWVEWNSSPGKGNPSRQQTLGWPV